MIGSMSDVRPLLLFLGCVCRAAVAVSRLRPVRPDVPAEVLRCEMALRFEAMPAIAVNSRCTTSVYDVGCGNPFKIPLGGTPRSTGHARGGLLLVSLLYSVFSIQYSVFRSSMEAMY